MLILNLHWFHTWRLRDSLWCISITASSYKTAWARNASAVYMKISISNFALSSHNVFTMTGASAECTWMKVCVFLLLAESFQSRRYDTFPSVFLSWFPLEMKCFFSSDHFNGRCYEFHVLSTTDGCFHRLISVCCKTFSLITWNWFLPYSYHLHTLTPTLYMYVLCFEFPIQTHAY